MFKLENILRRMPDAAEGTIATVDSTQQQSADTNQQQNSGADNSQNQQQQSTSTDTKQVSREELAKTGGKDGLKLYNEPDDKDLDIDDFVNPEAYAAKKAKAKAAATTDDKQQQQDDKQQKKDDGTKVEDVIKDDQQQQQKENKQQSQQQQSQQQQINVNKRDFTGIPEQHQPLFKNMSNDAFNTLKPIYIEAQQLKQQLTEKDKVITQLQQGKVVLPESYHEHPEAYTLTPEYSESVANLQDAQLEHRHWQQQLINIEEGKDWNDLGIDKEGNYVLLKAQPASPQAKAAILGKMSEARSMITEFNGRIHQLSTGFKQRHEAVVQGVKKVEDTYFPHLADETKIPQETKTIINNVKQAFHKQGFASNPLVNILAKAYATMVNMAEKINEHEVKKTTQAAIQEDKTKAGPTGNSFQATQQKAKQVTMDDFENLIRG